MPEIETLVTDFEKNLNNQGMSSNTIKVMLRISKYFLLGIGSFIGISDYVKHRPRELFRDDAGHGSSAVTDKYIDIELRERHRSAKKKPLYVLQDGKQ